MQISPTPDLVSHDPVLLPNLAINRHRLTTMSHRDHCPRSQPRQGTDRFPQPPSLVLPQDYLATESLDDLVSLLRKSRLETRLIDFFPPHKRTLADFDDHYKVRLPPPPHPSAVHLSKVAVLIDVPLPHSRTPTGERRVGGGGGGQGGWGE